MKAKNYAVVSVLLSTLLMCFVDGIISPPYLYKSIIKIVLFLLIPLSYFLLYKDKAAYLKKLFIPKKKDFLLALLLGIGVFVVIMIAYFLLGDYIDLSGIKESLTTGIGVTADNFMYVAFYISFVNSLLEEFFFRGFAFVTLKRHASRRLAYFLGAFLFAFYHVGMTVTWLPFPVFLAELAGLTGGGLIFNFLCEKTETVYPSYIVHMCCNFGINLIGFILFGVI